MAKIEFNFDGILTTIQCDINEKMKDIFKKYTTKIGKNINNIFFLYCGNKINEELTFKELAKLSDLEKKSMSLLVEEINSISNKSNIIKSKEVICPTCKESIKIKFDNYKVILFDCKKEHYHFFDLLLNEYEETQKIDESKIICDNCKEMNKANTYKNEFHKCLSCKMNLCPLCKNIHDQSHNIINYEKKNYICDKHNELYNSYCNKCKENLCMICENDHDNHDIFYYKKKLPNKDDKLKEMNELKEMINKMNNNIEEIIKVLNKVKDNINNYYQIIFDIINNFEVKNRNYQILLNINEINNKIIIDDLDVIINENNINKKFNKIIEIYEKMNKKDLLEHENLIKKLTYMTIIGEMGTGKTRENKLGDYFYEVQNKVNEYLGCSFRYKID